MNCPEQIADILLQILARGVVSARAAGWSEKLELATLEADHVHNLADLVRQYDLEKLVYYWDHERPSYIFQYKRLVGNEPTRFTELWQALQAWMPDVRATLPAVSRYHQRMEQLVQEMAARFKAENEEKNASL